MATYIKFNNNDTLYPAIIGGKISDKDWDGRSSKSIHVEMDYNTAVSLFTDEVEWSIVQDVERQVERVREVVQQVPKEVITEVIDEETQEVTEVVTEELVDEVVQETYMETVMEQEIYDNSEYCILGDITIHKDNTVTVKMGKATAEEILAILLGEE